MASSKHTRQATLLREYVNNIVEYCHIREPNWNKNDIANAVKDIVAKKIKRPTCTVLEYPQYGNIIEKQEDLLTFLNKYQYESITPAGHVFKCPSVGKPILSDKLNSDIAGRDYYKNKQFEAKSVGDSVMEMVNYGMQTKKKIAVNAITGAFESEYSILYDPPCYNGITSTCRHNTKVATAHTERFLMSNFYWRNKEDVINWFIQLLRVCPKKDIVLSIINKHDIRTPHHDDLINMVKDNLSRYKRNTSIISLSDFIYKLNTHEVAFIYYAFNMYNLFRYNEHVFRPWIASAIDIDINQVQEEDLSSINELDKDIITLIISSKPELIEGCTIKNIVDKKPEQAKELIHLCKNFRNKLKGISDLLSLFWNIPIDIPNIYHQHNMVRLVVPRGDTDSVFYTTKDWVKWYAGEITFDKTGFYVNALVTYMLSASIKIALANSCINLNVEDNLIHEIRLKNEFLFLINFSLPMGKHYANMTVIQEGVVLPKPIVSLSGKNLVGSDVCISSLNKIKSFIENDIIYAIKNNQSISSTSLIDKALKYEADIINSLNSGSTEYLKGMAIKLKTDYTQEETRSNYFFKLLWDSVFAGKYGEMKVPQRCQIVPLDTNFFMADDYMQWLKNHDKSIYKKLNTFAELYPKKTITRVFIPGDCNIPTELLNCIDIRSVVQTNMFGIYLALRALGISYQFDKKIILLSDFYTNPYINK